MKNVKCTTVKGDKTKVKVTCQVCNGSGKVKKNCSRCHGTGTVTCHICGGKGESKCKWCGGTGHACPVCYRGYITKDRWINCEECGGTGINDRGGRCYKCNGRGQEKEEYEEICPNCHGDYKNTDHVCDRCKGSGKVSCEKNETCPDCFGEHFEKCPNCKGHGSWISDKVSKCDLRVFRALFMIGGVFGLHYAYIKRWGLFTLQMIIFAFVVGTGLAPAVVAKSKNVSSFALMLGVLLIGPYIGLLKIKRAGTGGELRDRGFDNGKYWTFAVLFGWTGAHLMYIKSYFLMCLQVLIVAYWGYAVYCVKWCEGAAHLSDIFLAAGNFLSIFYPMQIVVAIFAWAIGRKRP